LRERERDRERASYSLEPGQLSGGQLVGSGMVEESFLQLGPDGFKLLEGGLLSHGGRSGGLEGGEMKVAMGITYKKEGEEAEIKTPRCRIKVAGRGEKEAK
jgi:hypothetical protein